MKKKIIRLSENDLGDLVRKVIKEDGEQLKLDFPNYDDRHPFLIEIEERLESLKIESQLQFMVTAIKSTPLASEKTWVDLSNRSLRLEQQISELEKYVYSKNDLPNEVTWPVADKVSKYLDICHDLQGVLKDISDVYGNINDVEENFND